MAVTGKLLHATYLPSSPLLSRNQVSQLIIRQLVTHQSGCGHRAPRNAAATAPANNATTSRCASRIGMRCCASEI
jgi:hypothetical protein